MTQLNEVPIDPQAKVKTNLTRLSNTIGSILTCFSGTAFPDPLTTPLVDGMRCWRTDLKAIYRYASAGNDWKREGPAREDASSFEWNINLSGLSATTTFRLPVPRTGIVIVDAVINSDTTTTDSSGNELRWLLTDKTGGGTVQLFSGTPGTYTYVAGVTPGSANGTGTDIVANTPYVLTVDQNGVIAANRALQFSATKSGTADPLTTANLCIRGYRTGNS